ncbi:MAG TPA: T9SS type A sorting domain-containing protein [Bacteroidia bacterium]|nr:T9SS type A sorting domain-containing protein [Bacteroidia bacterium]
MCLNFGQVANNDANNKDGLFAIDVGFGDTLLRNKTTNLGTIGTRYIIEFNATSSSHTIKFTNWGHICAGCTEVVLDDLRLYTLAELDASVPHCTVGIDFPSASVGLENLISPNPFTNELNIKTNSQELSEIIFYDIASRKLLQQSFINSFSVSTENFSKGIYFYEIRSKESVVKKGKVVKE